MLQISFIVALAGLAATWSAGQPPAPPGFAPRMFTRGTDRMPYRIFVPDETARRQPLPLVVWLHGAGGLGTDNMAQISAGGNDKGSGLWIRPDVQARFPAFVIAPQASTPWGAPSVDELTSNGRLVIDLIESLAQEFQIDRTRVYILGQSLGGIGVWDLITKRPDVFAAAVPLCAVGEPKRVATAVDVKVWVFHGAKDTGMPVGNARAMVAALKAAGGTVKYTEYPDLGHDIWTRTFTGPELPTWLFAQRRPTSHCDGLCR